MIVVEFEADAPILRETREAVPEMTITVESEQAPNGSASGPIHLQFWASGGDFDAFEEAVEADPTVTGLKRLASDSSGRRLYRVVYTDEGMAWTAHSEWVEADGTLLDAESESNGWHVRMRFPDREAVRQFQEWFQEHDLSFTLTGVMSSEPTKESEYGPDLTVKQREALLLAWEAGYFDVPRRIDLVTLAEDLDISDTALSQRLRRGMATWLEYEFGRR